MYSHAARHAEGLHFIVLSFLFFRKAALKEWKKKNRSQDTYGDLLWICVSNGKRSCADEIVSSLTT